MPRLPTAEDFGQRPVPGVPSRLPTEVSGAKGEAISSAGRQLMGMSQEFLQQEAVERDRADTMRAEESYNSLIERTMDLTEGDDGFRRKHGAQVANTDLTGDYWGRYQQAQREIESTLGNDAQKAKFKARADVLGLQYRRDLLQHIGREGDVYRQQVYDRALDVEVRGAALHWDDKMAVATSVERLNAIINDRAEADDWDDDTLTLERAKALSGLHSSVVVAALDQNQLKYADDYFKQISPEVDEATRHQLSRAIDGKRRELDAEARQQQVLARVELSETIADVEAASRSGITYEGPLPTRAEFNVYGDKAQERYDSFQRIVELGGDIQAAALANPQEQAALLAKNSPTAPSRASAGVESLGLTPAERKLYERHLHNLDTAPVRNADGSGSTLLQMTVEMDGRTYSIPTVWDGKVLSEDKALARAKSEGLENFPSYATREEAQARYDAMHRFIEKDVQSGVRQVASAGFKDAQERQQILATSIARINKEREDDPARFAIQRIPAVSAAYQAMVTAGPDNATASAEQYVNQVQAAAADLGIQSPKVLPDEFAGQIVGGFYDQKEGGEPAAERIIAERQRWGRAWPAVWSQISKDLPGAAYVIGAGMSVEAGRRLAEVSTVDRPQLDKWLATQNVKPADVKTAVASSLNNAALSLAGQPGADKLFATLADSAERLATRYVGMGKGVNDAAEQAANEVFNERYSFFDHNEATIRVPKPYDGREVKSALKVVTRDLSGVPRVDESQWVTLPNDAGVALTWMGGVVQRPDGSPVVYGWDDLLNRAATVGYSQGLPPDPSRRVR